MGYLKSKVYQGDPQDLTELKRDIKKEFRGISRECTAKFYVKQGSEQSCAAQEKADFSSTCRGGVVVERGDVGPAPKNIQRMCSEMI